MALQVLTLHFIFAIVTVALPNVLADHLHQVSFRHPSSAPDYKIATNYFSDKPEKFDADDNAFRPLLSPDAVTLIKHQYSENTTPSRVTTVANRVTKPDTFLEEMPEPELQLYGHPQDFGPMTLKQPGSEERPGDYEFPNCCEPGIDQKFAIKNAKLQRQLAETLWLQSAWRYIAIAAGVITFLLLTFLAFLLLWSLLSGSRAREIEIAGRNSDALMTEYRMSRWFADQQAAVAAERSFGLMREMMAARASCCCCCCCGDSHGGKKDKDQTQTATITPTTEDDKLICTIIDLGNLSVEPKKQNQWKAEKASSKACGNVPAAVDPLVSKGPTGAQAKICGPADVFEAARVDIEACAKQVTDKIKLEVIVADPAKQTSEFQKQFRELLAGSKHPGKADKYTVELMLKKPNEVE
jgi:hypothetical protein